MNKSKELLKQRATQLAQPVETTAASSLGIEHIVFVLASETYALEATFVKEVFFLKDLTLIPGAPPFILGIVNLRGSVVSLLNLKVILGLPDQGLSEMNKVIVLQGGGIEFGIVADAIHGSMEVSDLAANHEPAWKSGNASNFVSGVAPNGTIFLNTTKLTQYIMTLKSGNQRKTKTT